MATPRKSQPLPQLPKHKGGVEADGELNYLWAVSYSDLLMVLMSFFILFFQMEPSEVKKGMEEAKPSAIQNLVIALQNQVGGPGQEVGPPAPPRKPAEAAAASTSASTGTLGNGPGTGTGASISSIRQHFKKAELPFVQEADDLSIVIHFEDNFYDPGQYTLTRKKREKLENILQFLRPYGTNVHLTFVGHSDATPVSRATKKLIDSNLILSNLRATRAVELAMTMGLDPRKLTAQGVGEHSRQTRSLSVRISERGTLQ